MKNKLFFYLFACSVVLGVVFFSSACSKKKELREIRYLGSYTRDFGDLNALHLEAAKRVGVEPVSNREEAEKHKKDLKEVVSNRYFKVMELQHSIPFLVPKAHKLLHTIAENFKDSLLSHNAPLYTLRVTSILRTKDDIKKLKRRNVNATQNSAHLYGTTFDIAWNRYDKVQEKDERELSPEQLKQVLAMVLRDLKKGEACFIKHEKKQGCFHITVN